MLLFCRDRILRKQVRQYNPETKQNRYVNIPMRTYQQFDPQAFLKQLLADFKLEEGVTVADLFLNLEPWADLMEGLASMDFRAFCEEAKKPSRPMDDLSHVVVRPLIELKAVPEFERSGSDRDFLDLFRNRKAVVTDRYEMVIRWDSSVVLKTPRVDPNIDDHEYSEISCDYSPLDEWGHCPVVIERTATIIDDTPYGHRAGFLSSSIPLINPDSPLVNEIRDNQGKAYSHYMKAETFPNFMDTLVRGCFWEWGFHYSPVGRDQAREEITASVEELNEKIGDGREPRDDSLLVQETLSAHDEGLPSTVGEDSRYNARSFRSEAEFNSFICERALELDPATRVVGEEGEA